MPNESPRRNPPQIIDMRPPDRRPQPPRKSKNIIKHLLGSSLKFALAAIILVGIALAGYLLSRPTKPVTIPDHITKSAPFRLYYPAKLPSGYKVDAASFRLNNDVVLYQIKHTTGNVITVSQQAKAANFDYSALSSTNAFVATAGSATIGTRDNFSSASVINDSTWILMRTTRPTPTDELKKIITGLRVD